MPKQEKVTLPGEVEPALDSENVLSETPSEASEPSPVEVKPEIIKPNEADNEVKIPIVPKGGIEVVATRKGFYGQMRKREGDVFTVPKFESLGEWMRCKDPVLEKKRVEFFKEKKKKAKK